MTQHHPNGSSGSPHRSNVQVIHPPDPDHKPFFSAPPFFRVEGVNAGFYAGIASAWSSQGAGSVEVDPSLSVNSGAAMASSPSIA